MSKTSPESVSLCVSARRRTRPTRPMPQTQTPHTRPPAPVALLLTPTHTRRPTNPAGRPLPDWYGIHPDHVAHLLARYTRHGDTVLDLDGHPTVTAAAEHLHRCPGLAVTNGEHPHVRPETLDGHPTRNTRPEAGLVLATLPRLNIDSRDPNDLSQAIGAWQTLLRPGGYLLVLLTTGPQVNAFGHRSTVIAAARTAGLLYHQHIPALLVRLPETEPRTDTRPAPRPPLHAGRHVRAHRDLLVFASMTPEAANV